MEGMGVRATRSFGKVVSGIDVVDAIRAVKTGQKTYEGKASRWQALPPALSGCTHEGRCHQIH